MTESHADAPQLHDGTDVQAEPEEPTTEKTPATSDPAEFTEDQELGGVGGQSPGGAG